MKNIFNVYVLMQDQSQCDRMKQVCVENGLPIWKYKKAFIFEKDKSCFFHFDYEDDEFYVCTPYMGWFKKNNLTKVTETEFIELLKQYKDDK